jgi:predicted nucleotidyltransferase
MRAVADFVRCVRYLVFMASPALIRRAGEALAEAAGSSSRVILFGSHARFGETVRLGKLVGELGVPADVIVVSEEHVREWGELPGTMLHDALTQGRVLVGRGS